MSHQQQGATSNCNTSLRTMIRLFCAAVIATTMMAQAQTFSVLHSFTGGSDGSTPMAGLSIDGRGNLYGTTQKGGNSGTNCHVNYLVNGCGTAFKVVHGGSGWALTPIYSFTGESDGAEPSSRVVFGPDGALYGTNVAGGNQSGNCAALDGCGTVYRLTPQATACKTPLCPWVETPVWIFQNPTVEGGLPSGDPIFDNAGILYDTTGIGGSTACGDGLGCGTVFELTNSGSGWLENVLYAFPQPFQNPLSGVIADSSGKLYGTIQSYSGNFSSAVFQLVPNGSGWTENTLYEFVGSQNGNKARAGLVFNQMGYLVGGTESGGQTNFGTVFQLNPLPGGGWNFSTVYNFQRAAGGPWANLTVDSAGNLYGTAMVDGAHTFGSVFKLTFTDQGWVYTDLHDFNISDGAYPISSVLIDANGNLYGTTSQGGAYGYGVVWEITP